MKTFALIFFLTFSNALASSSETPPPERPRFTRRREGEKTQAGTIEKQQADRPQAPQTAAEKPATPNQVQTEEIKPAQAGPAVPPSLAASPGYLAPAQFTALLHTVWLAEFRAQDLLSQVNSTHWKMTPDSRNSFESMVEGLRRQLATLEQERGEFEKRPESLYRGFKTYASMIAVQAPLEAVARNITQFENASLGNQYGKAGDEFLKLGQEVEPYLAFLARNQDAILEAVETNLASCQNELGYAMRGHAGPAIPMKNAAPVRAQPRRQARPPERRSKLHKREKPARKRATGKAQE